MLEADLADKVARQNLQPRAMGKNRTTTNDSIVQKKWRWIGHTLRRPQPNIARQALDWNPQGTRVREENGINTWRRTLDIELRKTRMSWGEARLRPWIVVNGVM
jgi:hypothetical protein